MQVRRFGIQVVALVVGLLLASYVVAQGSPVRKNLWSLHFLNSIESVSISKEAPQNHPRAALWQVQSAMRRGKFAEASAYVSALPEESQLAARANAELNAASGKWTEAIDAWEEIADFNSLLLAANDADSEGRVDDAYAAYRASSRVAPARGSAQLAEFLLSQGAEGEAVSVLVAVAMENPDSAYRDGWIRKLGRIFRDTEQLAEGIEVLERLMRGDTRDAVLWSEIGRLTYALTNDPDRALEYLYRADALEPQRSDGLRAAATILAAHDRFEEADLLLTEWARRKQSQMAPQIDLANNARAAGNYGLALSRYEDLEVRFGENAQIAYEMSQLYRLRAEPARAIAAIERALKLDESRKSYWYRAGELYQWTEDPDRARSAYETALRLDPGFRQATVALQRLTDQ